MAEIEPQAETEHQGPPAISAGQPETSEAVRRADAILNDMGVRLGGWAARMRHEAARMTARTREELEDMWAEAQALHHQASHGEHDGARREEGHSAKREEHHDEHEAASRKARSRTTHEHD